LALRPSGNSVRLPTATHTSLYRQAVNIYAYIKIKNKINLKEKAEAFAEERKRMVVLFV